jgi:hypothetical protein
MRRCGCWSTPWRRPPDRSPPLEVLNPLIDRVRTVPLLVVLTHRPKLVATEPRWRLNLSKLTRAQSAAMISGLSGGKALPATLRDSLMARLDRFMPVKEIAQIGNSDWQRVQLRGDRRGRPNAAGPTR